jgi:hypothetical protein
VKPNTHVAGVVDAQIYAGRADNEREQRCDGQIEGLRVFRTVRRVRTAA